MSRIALYSALVEAGASKEKAEEAVKELVFAKEAATKADMNGMGNGMKAEMTELKIKMAQVKESVDEMKASLLMWLTIQTAVIIVAVVALSK